jgi:thiol-disulfide isomerase/thioredoxin
MGRLPALTIAIGALALSSGCDVDGKKPPVLVTKARNEAVQASGTAPAPSPTLTAQQAPKPVRAPRKLCEGQLEKPGRDMPRQRPSRMAAPGEKMPGTAIPIGGSLTWINLWAAWCVPCKEEMPRLRSFASRLAQTGQAMNLVFVSLDDDDRQLESFLQGEPTSGMRSTYWLREGGEREQWLSQAGLSKDPQLPAHVIVDRRGKIRCIIGGAIEDEDFAEVRALVSNQ